MAQRKVFSIDPADTVDIQIGDSGIEATKPITIGQLFKNTVDRFADHTALSTKEENEWKKITYKEYYDLSIRTAKSFLKLGLEPLHSVAIMGFNSVEWFLSNFGAIFAGGLSSGIYPTNSPDVCKYICNDCKANIAVVEDDIQLQKFLQIRDQLPDLKAIVQYKGTLSDSYPNVYDWEQFLKLGDSVNNKIVEDKISAQKPQDCAGLIYTSGTTGDPKGVMLSHDNITFTVKSLRNTYNVAEPSDRVVSYLPLSHIAAQMADLYLPIEVGSSVYFARPDALKGSLGDTLRDVQPTMFVGVPRVWEKFKERIQQMLPPPGSGPPPSAEQMKVIQQKVAAGLGLPQANLLITCAAPMIVEVFVFFEKLGLELCDIWGMSEGTGPGTTTTKSIPDQWKFGTVGKPFFGVQLKIDNPDPTTGDGEICFRGRTVMMGYLNKYEKTRETIDDEGWVHSGDIGRQDEEGFLTITGRIKELIITSGGENIAPVPIENRIKKQLPFLSNVMLIGDKRNYLVCLVTLKSEMDPNTGAPLDDLTPEAIQLLSALGSSAITVSQVLDTHDKTVYDAIKEGIDKANESAISRPQKVQTFAILKQDFSISGGELGPTLKLKRFNAVKKYSDEIEKLYQD